MKIVCDRAELLDALSGVSRATSSKSSIPAIEGILFNCTPHVISLTGYDLEIGIMTSVPADVTDPMDVVIPSHLLIEMVKRLDAERVTIDIDGGLRISLSGSTSQFSFMGMPASDFPEMHMSDPTTSLTIQGSRLRAMIGKTLYAVSTSDQKPVHTGTKFVMDSEGLTMVSVDGYRLALCREPAASFAAESSFVVPGKTLLEVSKLIGDGEADVTIGTERRTAVFKFGDYTVFTRLLEGDFLDYAKSIPVSGKTQVRIPVSSLYSAVERASLLISDRFKSPIRMEFEDTVLSLSCSTALGTSFDEIPCAVDGEAVEIGFNNRYILDALRNCGEEEVLLELSGALSPMKILPVEGTEFLFLVLPVRIRNDI